MKFMNIKAFTLFANMLFSPTQPEILQRKVWSLKNLVIKNIIHYGVEDRLTLADFDILPEINYYNDLKENLINDIYDIKISLAKIKNESTCLTMQDLRLVFNVFAGQDLHEKVAAEPDFFKKLLRKINYWGKNSINTTLHVLSNNFQKSDLFTIQVLLVLGADKNDSDKKEHLYDDTLLKMPSYFNVMKYIASRSTITNQDNSSLFFEKEQEENALYDLQLLALMSVYCNLT